MKLLMQQALTSASARQAVELEKLAIRQADIAAPWND